MTKLEPVPLEDLDPDDRECTICQQEFCVSEDANLSHPPVKTICGHNFGKLCITSCPTCREVFFPQPDREPMELLAARLWLWDNAYAFAGVARSEIEERSREHLWKYVKYCRSINEFELSDKVQHEFFVDSFSNLLQYAQRLKLIPLTPVQEALRKKLEKLGGLEPLGTIWKAEDGSRNSWVFDPVLLKEEEALRKNLKKLGGLYPNGTIWEMEDDSRNFWVFDLVSLAEEDEDDEDEY